ncbi:MAG: tRNA (adenosine(37)-N6)-dimethylallyltransferase MiaA [Chlorobi bacterium]|nr:tRNA (adenosine(37)-N6)-dimethylallyltransferase MiaA [Chlorobiota bacterium]
MEKREKKKHLVVIAGPTGIGKTDLSIRIAKELDTIIVSADSRQIYRELKIGTAAPTPEQLAEVPHFMVGTKSIHDYYSAFEFEQEVIALLKEKFKEYHVIIMTGGSMMYVDAVCKGIDDIPTIDPELRNEVFERYQREGIESIRRELKLLDPVFYNQVDLKNHKRVIHAVEVCLMAGKPYSSLRKNNIRKRDFEQIHIGLDMNRSELYDRINKRVDMMLDEGLEEEARRFYEYRQLNSLNTVGYKELFEYFDGKITLEKAVELIKRNSRRYAKKQLSWFRRDKEMNWFHPASENEIMEFIQKRVME